MPAETAQPIDFQAERIRAVKDVNLLLEFLGQRADSKLQAHFEDTRGDLTAPIGKLAAPPCRTYRHFLNRLIAIGGPLPGLRADAPQTSAPPDSAPEGDERLSDMAFLYFARDFLAAVASPATVETIRVTRAYIACRRYSLVSRLLGLHKRSMDTRDECTAGAGRLARRVILVERMAFCLTLVTLVISAYALTGHMILDKQDQILTNYAAIGHDMEELAKEMPAVIGTLASISQPPPYCDMGTLAPAMPVKEAGLVPQSDGSPSSQTAAPTVSISRLAAMQVRQCSVYWRIKHAREDIAAVTLHLVSWTRVVIGLPAIGDVFGVDRTFIRESAGMHAEWCDRLGLEVEADGHCGPQLQDMIYHTREVADSLLGCIALYVLPALYGCLGAAAATFRTLRRKVDQSLVAVTDRGRVQQDVILGLLCGAIIGLFVGYIGKATPEEGLGLSALALLAGYNVSGVFAFLDELSKRVFQPAPADKGAG
jgi:hypothetical protein